MTLPAWLARLFSPCLFGHVPDLHFDRTDKGKAIWRCPRCLQPVERIVGRGDRKWRGKGQAAKAVPAKAGKVIGGRFT